MTHTRFAYSHLARVIAFGVCAWVVMALATAAVAQEAAAEDASDETKSSDSDQEPKPQRVDSPAADPLSIPTKDDWRDERRRLDEKTLFGSSSMPIEQRRQQQELARQFEELKRQQEALIEERSRLEQEFRRAMLQFEQLQHQAQREREPKIAELQRAMAEQEAARAEMAALAARHNQQNVQLPQGATTRVFALQNSPAAESARVLSEILGGKPLRIAVDERTNSLIVMADEETSEVVEALLTRLDVSPPRTQQDLTGETLQLRIVWLLDGNDEHAKQRSANFVGVNVIKALNELGFESPEVVCQQVATFTMGTNREGRFDFHVPVLINSQRWQFQGQGQVQPIGNDRFNLRFDLGFSQVDPRTGRNRSGESGQLGGSIHTPLGHYTVMGTTTFVSTTPREIEKTELIPPGVTRVDPPGPQQQHLSAFVVYLDRAREFPAAGAPSRQPNDDRR